MTEDQFTNQDFMLEVGDRHQIHVVDWGNPDAETPFVYLHGGPGGQVKDKHKVTFDPNKHRVIFFDQRGCGASTPCGSLKHNTIEDLAHDISKIVDHLKIDTFNLYGFSWGSTLALYYAIQHPDKVKNLIIGGVYSGANDFSKMLARLQTFFPDIYTKLLQATPEEHREDFITYHQNQILAGTPAQQKKSAYLIETLEFTLANYNFDLSAPENYAEFDPVSTIIETHYIANHCFLPDDYLLNHASEITSPTYIIQGRSDLVCPPDFAYQISQQIPNSKIFWTNSNHYFEREVASLLRVIFSML